MRASDIRPRRDGLVTPDMAPSYFAWGCFRYLYLHRQSWLLTHRLANRCAPAVCGNLRDLAVDDVNAAVGAGG